jgi:hypothetical protein
VGRQVRTHRPDRRPPQKGKVAVGRPVRSRRPLPVPRAPTHTSSLLLLVSCRYNERNSHNDYDEGELEEGQVRNVLAHPTDTSNAGATSADPNRGREERLWDDAEMEYYENGEGAVPGESSSSCHSYTSEGREGWLNARLTSCLLWFECRLASAEQEAHALPFQLRRGWSAHRRATRSVEIGRRTVVCKRPFSPFAPFMITCMCTNNSSVRPHAARIE